VRAEGGRFGVRPFAAAPPRQPRGPAQEDAMQLSLPAEPFAHYVFLLLAQGVDAAQ
jgi:hypothetical protein